MTRLLGALVSCLVLCSTAPAALAAPDATIASGPSIDAVRASWPIAREPSGRWGVVGEAVVHPWGSQPAHVRRIVFTITSASGAALSREVFETADQIASVFRVYGTKPPTGPVAGTIVGSGETGVAYLATLVGKRSLPARATVAFTFVGGTTRTFTVPLQAVLPPQRFRFPLSLEGEPWVALNTAGTDAHWIGGSVPTGRGLFSSQRFAIDLVQIDADGRTHPEGATDKEAYYAWGEDVGSSGAGTVVEVLDGERDLEIGETLPAEEHPAGNHVVVRYGPRLFGVYGHLQRGSVRVTVGQTVGRGQVIGLVGNSGNTSEPHLHVHVADGWSPRLSPIERLYFSQGVPAVFWGARVLRDGALLPLSGSTPLELDVIIGPDGR